MTHARSLVVRLAAVLLATGLLLPAVAARAGDDVHLAVASAQRSAPAKKPHHAPAAAKAKPRPKATARAKAAPKAKVKHTAKVVAKKPKAHPKAKLAPKPKKLGSQPVRSELQAAQGLAASAGSRAAAVPV